MTQEEFKKLLDKKNHSYKQDGKWLIIYGNINFSLCKTDIVSLPEYLIFECKNVDISYNYGLFNLSNIIFKNKGYVSITDNHELETISNLTYLNDVHVIISENIKLKNIDNNRFYNKSNTNITSNKSLEIIKNTIFNNNGFVNISYNDSLTYIPKNVYFGNNVTEIYLTENTVKFDYYCYYLKKIKENVFKILNDNIINKIDDNIKNEKVISNLNVLLIYLDKKYQTLNLCLDSILKDKNVRGSVKINLPKNFLSISSWI